MIPHLIPLPSCRTSGAAPHAVPGLRRVPVLHRGLLTIAACPAPFARIDAPVQRPAVAKRGLSTRHATRPTPLHRMDRAGLALLKPVAVAVDGSYPVIQESAYRVTPNTQENRLPGAGFVQCRPFPRILMIPRRWAGNINAPERTTVSRMQRPSEPQLIAEGIDNIIPFIRRNFAASDGIDQEEQACLNTMTELSSRSLRHAEIIDLNHSLERVGITKRNARRLRELFPELGPGAA